MNFDRSEWIGNWENFELYFTDDAPAMVRSWEDAEKSVKENKNGLISAILFRHGAKRFWQDACYTVCLLYTSPSPRDGLLSRMPSSA